MGSSQLGWLQNTSLFHSQTIRSQKNQVTSTELSNWALLHASRSSCFSRVVPVILVFISFPSFWSSWHSWEVPDALIFLYQLKWAQGFTHSHPRWRRPHRDNGCASMRSVVALPCATWIEDQSTLSVYSKQSAWILDSKAPVMTPYAVTSNCLCPSVVRKEMDMERKLRDLIKFQLQFLILKAVLWKPSLWVLQKPSECPPGRMAWRYSHTHTAREPGEQLVVQVLNPFTDRTFSYEQRGNRAGEEFALQQTPVKLITRRWALINRSC